MRLYLLILLSTITFSSRAEFSNKDYSRVDSISKSIKRTSNLEKLSENLTKNFTETDEKYRSIFTWVATNISYDCEAKKDPSKRTIDPKKVIKQRKAVCSGYSSLFEELCKLSNLECITIVGWTKNDPRKIGKSLSKKSTHAWNAIKINDKWYLCDVTWGAGSTSNNCEQFNFNYKGYYFCTEPNLFCVNHFPENKKWFLNSKIGKSEFINAPHLYGNAINFGITTIKPKNGIIKYEKGKQLNFQFDVKDNITIDKISVYISSDKYSEPVEFTRSGNNISFKYNIEKYGYYLKVYANNKCIIVYKIIK